MSVQSNQSVLTERTRPLPWIWGAAALLVLLFFQVLNGAHDASLTADEPVHILRGYVLWRGGDFRLQHGHPPLIHFISGAALALEADLPPPQTLPGWEQADRMTMAQQLLAGSPQRLDRIVWLARYPIALLALLLGAVVFRWAREWLGPSAGMAALVFLACDPNIVAHAGLITTDLGVSAFFFAAAYAFYRALRQPTPGRLAIAGIAFGLAQAAKLSALILGPAFVLIAVLSALQMPHRQGKAGLFLSTAIIFVMGGLTLWAVYGFQWGQVPGLGLSLPAPAYWVSLMRLRDHEELGHRAYLLGQVSSEGWWYYFPVAFLVKTPLPTLIALALAGIAWLRWARRRGFSRAEYGDMAMTSLVVPPLAFLAVSINSRLNIGYRHILPVLPFAFVFASQIICLPGVQRRCASKMRGVVAALLLLWLAVEALAIQPYPLAYFNQLAGGPAQGYRVLADSNLDWGQDLKRLAAVLKARGIERPWLSYFGGADPALYGIEYRHLPAPPPSPPTPDYYPFNPAPGVYAISASNLVGVSLDEPDAFYIFRQREPFARVGYSIFLYRIEPTPLQGDWVGTCAAPDRPYDDERIRQGFGLPDLRIAQFDCRSSWLYAEGGKPGWYLIPVDTEGPTLAGRFLAGLEPIFRSRRTATHPPFTLFYWPGGTLAFTRVDPLANFGGVLTFLGYRLEVGRVAAGEAIHVDTVWQVTGTGLGSISILAHLTAPDGHLVSVGDGLGVTPESWAVGDVIVQTHTIQVPEDAAPGLYTLQTGLYTIPEGRRFLVRGGGAAGADRLSFAQVRVGPQIAVRGR